MTYNNFYLEYSNIIGSNFFLIGLSAFLLCLTTGLIHIATNIGTNSTHKDVSNLSEKYGNKTLQDNKSNRGEIDLRYVTVNRGVWMIFHSNNQLITPNRATSLIYDHNDRSGSSISDMLVSNCASSVSISVGGVITRGFELSGLPNGVVPNSKLINVKPLWVAQAHVNNNITTIGIMLPPNAYRWSILTVNPAISSMRDARGRDLRHSIEHIVSRN